MPDSATLCERNWSSMVSVAERVPTAAGMKLTWMAQVLCAASEFPQALVAVNSLELTEVAMRVSATSPVLVSITDCAALVLPTVCCAKVSVAAESVSVAGALAVPESCAVWVPAESLSESCALRAPLAVGVKVTESVQPVETPSVALHVLAEMAKSDALAPLIVGVCSVATVPPKLATRMFCTAAL